MTPTLIPTAPLPAGTRPELPLGLTGLPPGLTELDATRIAAAIDAGRTASTLAVYAAAWRRWERWCASRRIVPLPATPLVVSKSDPEARGQVVGVAHGQHPATDPVAALDAWITARGSTPGVLFTSLRGRSVSLDPISGNAIARMLKTRAEAAGLPTDRITAHSLRAGHATTAALAGAGVERIAAQTRHRGVATLVEHYIRPMEVLQTTSSRDLSL